MASLIFDTATGEAVSVGTVVADPLPAGLSAVVLTGPEWDGLRDRSLKWDPATRTIVVDAERAAELAAEAAAQAERTQVRSVISALVTYAALSSPTAAQTRVATQQMARALVRIIPDVFDGAS